MSEPPDSADVLVLGFRLPQKIGAFLRGEALQNDTQGRDFTVGHHGRPWGEATAYLYDSRHADIGDGPHDERTRIEFDRCTQTVLDSASRRGDNTIRFLGRYGTVSAARGSEFLCVEFVQASSRGPQLTRLYLTVTGGRFVKLRVTLFADDLRDPSARLFADGFAALLWPSGTERGGPTVS